MFGMVEIFILGHSEVKDNELLILYNHKYSNYVGVTIKDPLYFEYREITKNLQKLGDEIYARNYVSTIKFLDDENYIKAKRLIKSKEFNL
jgi:hypothetical protein